MKQFKIGILVFVIMLITNCENKKEELTNLTSDARITGFVTEKCYCCWGWIVEIGSTTIKADSIPGLSLKENTVFPINARITIGSRTRACSEYKIDMDVLPDYYEIKNCTIIK
jgi:hypothetical protein